MSQLVSLLLSAVMFWPMVLQTPVEKPAIVNFYSVSYVEVTPGSRQAAIAALREYRAASGKEDGFGALEFFEQAGRPGHFAVIETWRDQKAFDARAAALQKNLTDRLQPIRISDLDRRPYKTLTTAPPRTPNSGMVYVITHVDVSPNPQVPLLLQRMAEESRKDVGNLRFDVLQHTMRANHFTVIEAWRDRKALDAHAGAAHTKQYRDELAPALGSPLDERLFERVQL